MDYSQKQNMVLKEDNQHCRRRCKPKTKCKISNKQDRPMCVGKLVPRIQYIQFPPERQASWSGNKDSHKTQLDKPDVSVFLCNLPCQDSPGVSLVRGELRGLSAIAVALERIADRLDAGVRVGARLDRGNVTEVRVDTSKELAVLRDHVGNGDRAFVLTGRLSISIDLNAPF
jgi:hypothetical protein